MLSDYDGPGSISGHFTLGLMVLKVALVQVYFPSTSVSPASSHSIKISFICLICHKGQVVPRSLSTPTLVKSHRVVRGGGSHIF
jgi:hypothetical protein